MAKKKEIVVSLAAQQMVDKLFIEELHWYIADTPNHERRNKALKLRMAILLDIRLKEETYSAVEGALRKFYKELLTAVSACYGNIKT